MQSMNIGNGRNQAEYGKVLEKALHGDNQELRDYKNGCVHTLHPLKMLSLNLRIGV